MPDRDGSVCISDLSIAIAHWHINSWGGAEYLVTRLAQAVGNDVVYTMGSPDPKADNPYGDIEFVDVTDSLSTSYIRRFQQQFDRIFEYAMWEDVDWRDYDEPDLLITSGATTRAVITPDDVLHINYCHSPPRWFYDLYHDRKASLKGILLRPLIRFLRGRDQMIDPRVDHYLVNSPIVKRRLWKYYKRSAQVLYPPIEIDRYWHEPEQDFYLHLGRLDDEKGVTAIVNAFAETEYRLVMAGGRGNVDESIIEIIRTSDNIEWCGFVDEEKKHELLAQCRAVIFNGRNEDFGIVPIEAMASGKPVLTRDDGFPSLVVQNEETGILHDGTRSGIVDALDDAATMRFDQDIIRGRAEYFSYEHFQDQLQKFLIDWYTGFIEQTATPPSE